MSSTTVQHVNSTSMGIYDPSQQISMWIDSSRRVSTPSTMVSPMVQLLDVGIDSKVESISQNQEGSSNDEQREGRIAEKVQRRLAQNRQAARKSRLRKKVYVQQLETSRSRLVQVERELEIAKQQNAYGRGLQALYVESKLHSNVGFAGNISSNTGIATFEMEYVHWVEEQLQKNCELRNALQADISDVELQILIEANLKHYFKLFRMKVGAAKDDIFYLMSGMWRTSIERFLHWIGGYRPSELLNTVMPQLEPLTDQQVVEIRKLHHSSQQAEDALSQGLDKLQQDLIQVMSADGFGGEVYVSQMAAAMEKLEAFEGFVNQADNLREQNLQLLSRILTPRQAARGLLALGEYFHRLRALSSLWATRPCDRVYTR